MKVSLRRGSLAVAGIVLAAVGLQAQAVASKPVSTKVEPGLTGAPPPPSDGYFGPRTLEAQKALDSQRSHLVNTYGIADSVIYEMPPAAFSQADPGMLPTEDGQGGVYDASGDASHRFFAPVNLPNGSLVNYLDLYYTDTNASDYLFARFFSIDSGNTLTFLGEVDSITDTGFGYNFFMIDPPIQIDNTKRYMVYLDHAYSSGLEFNGVNLWYNLQVSPAPATPTFGDVPTSDPGFQYIEALVSSGITAGCGGGNYCPDNTLTRRQMAVFLSKALGLHFPG